MAIVLEALLQCFQFLSAKKDMYYELENGELKREELGVAKYSFDQISRDKYIADLDEQFMVVINSVTDRCFVLPRDILFEGVDEKLFHKLNTPDSNLDKDNYAYRNEVTFILAITYSCNLKCSYCYQQHDATLDKKSISMENLMKIFGIIERYKNEHPEKIIELGLFGGEPLLKTNETIIESVLEFCKKNKIRVHITTNGSFLEYYLKKLIIYRNFISSINPTIDTMKLNFVTRHSLSAEQNREEETEKLLKCIRTLIEYGIHVNLATNVDKHNLSKLKEIRDDLETQGFLKNSNFTWSIGRVDDRLYETNYPDIIMEGEVLEEMIKMDMQENIQAAFLKTSYNMVRKLGIVTNQQEHKGKNNYCWTSSGEDEAYYIDSNLKTYRCTYTVGRPQYSIFDFSIENLEKYKIPVKDWTSYSECSGCNIRGFCGGGCQLSHIADFKRNCQYEKDSFDYFMKNIFKPMVMELMCSGEA